MKEGQEWGKWQIDYLVSHYPNERAEDISSIIGKSKSSVQHKAHQLGIRKDREGFYKVRSIAQSGANSGNFKGYRRRTSKGYIALYRPNHPMATKDGLVMEHRVIMEEHLGTFIPKGFTVHHINGIKDDNRIENLALMTNSAHSALHNHRDEKQKHGKEHPLYKDFDKTLAQKLRLQGYTVNQICETFAIGRTKYFKEMRGE